MSSMLYFKLFEISEFFEIFETLVFECLSER